MGGFDATTWDAVGFALTAVGLVLSVLVWRRRGGASGLRGVGWSLLPAAAALTGVLRLLAEIAGAIARWAVHFAFNPFAWLGIGLAGIAVVAYGIGTVLRSHRRLTQERTPGRQTTTRRLGGSASTPAAGVSAATDRDDDMADIEAILKKHGIS